MTQWNRFIKAQITLLLLTSLGLSFGGALWFIWTTLDERFRTLELRETQTNIDRVAEVISNEIGNLGTRVPDWADWDDAVEYLATGDPEFASANLAPEVLGSMNLDSVRYYKLDGTLHGGNDAEGLTEILTNGIATAKDLWPKADAEGPNKGLVRLGENYYMFASQGVRPTSGEGDPKGMLIFLKKVDEELAKKVSSLTKIEVKITEASGNQDFFVDFPLPGRDHELHSIEKSAYSAIDPKVIRSRVLTYDNQKQAALIFDFELSRDLLAQGHQTIRTVALAFTVCLVLTLTALSFGLQNIVVRRLSRLTTEVSRITEQHSEKGQVPVEGENEVARLAQGINQMLEVIQEKNKAIRDIVTNVRAGFLILDAQGTVCEGYTAHCHTLFGRENLAGLRLSELLFDNNREQENFDCLYEQVMENLIPEQLTLPQLPNKIHMGARWIRLEGAGIYNGSGLMIGVLFTVTDITAQILVEKRNEENSALLKIIRSINNFAAFKEGAKLTLEQLRKEPQMGQRQAFVRRCLHTLKGNFSVYGLREIAHHIHEIEGEPQIEHKHIESIIQRLESFLDSHQDLIGITYAREWQPVVTLPRSSFMSLRKDIQTWNHIQEASAHTLAFLDQALTVPFGECILPLQEEAQRIAQKLKKNIEIEVRGGDIGVDLESLRPIFDSLVHAVRNSIDHGLETQEQRKLTNKPATGKITFRADKAADHSLTIDISDDGRGIDVPALKEAVKKSFYNPGFELATASREKLLQLVFVDGLSTKAEVSDLSGRGVGLSALRAEVEQSGGHVEILSEPGQGTTIRMSWKALPVLVESVA